MFSTFHNLVELLGSPFFNLLFVMTAVWSVGIFFERLRFPLIIGELLAGVILGPAVLNWVLDTTVLEALAQLGMFFLMFYAGLENNPKDFRGHARESLIIGLGGTLVPFLLGYFVSAAFGGTLYANLLIGAVLASTSLVMKTRILYDLNILKTKLGLIMTGAGIVDTVFSFSILALIIKSVANGGLTPLIVAITGLEVAVFFAVTIFIGVILFPKVGPLFSSRSGKGFTFALIMGLFFALLAEAIHLPFVLGAYLAGLFVREEIMSKELVQKMDDRFLAISQGFLGPIFIMSVALKVSFDIFATHGWLVLALFLAAFLGKLFGVFFSGLLTRLSKEESLAIGFGLNGRGGVELVIALIGVELGVISNLQLSALVFVSFATTLLASFALRLMLKSPA